MTIPLDLDGAAVVITGAGSGIGRATAVSMSRRGSRVLVSDLREDRAIAVAAEITAAGHQAVSVAADASSEADLNGVRDVCLGAYGRVDVIMNNAGVLAMGRPESLPDEAWQRVFDINVLGIARSNRVFLPLLLEQGRGHIVNTASASGLLGYGFDRLPYVASKHAVVGISEALAIYLGPRGVGVTCLCPSGVMTNVLEGITVYGETGVSPQAPQHSLSSAEDVGELVAEAVTHGRFRVTTAPEILDDLATKAADIEEFIQARIREQE